MTTVFVSHASQDRDFVAREIVQPLQGHNIETWYSTDEIETADKWADKITAGLKSCEWFLVVLSPRSVTSEWVKDETHWAFTNRPNNIIPVLLQDCDLSLLYLRLSRIQYVDFRYNVASGQAKLIALLGRTSPPGTEDQTEGKVLQKHSAISIPPEKVLWQGGFSARMFAGYWLTFLLLAALAAFYGRLATPTARSVLLLVAALTGLLLLLHQIYRQLSLRYELTNRAIRTRSGLGKVVTHQIDLANVEQLNVSTRLSEALRGLATIRISSGDPSVPELVMPAVREAKAVSTQIYQAVQLARFNEAN